MKVHITNIYGFNNDDQYIKKQHDYTDIGRNLDFREMGLFRYPVDSDTDSELSKRLDGVIASIEHGDVTFVQLPSGNGYKFDHLLIDKLKAYQSKVVLMIHELFRENNWLELYRRADSIIVFGRKEKTYLEYKGLDNIYILQYKNEFSVKKLYLDLLENVHYVYQRVVPELENEIQMGFGLYDKDGNYSVYVGTAIQSILDHTDSNICFHILHDQTLNDDNKRKLLRVGNTYHSRLVFHEVDTSEFVQLKEQVGHFSIGSLFRVELPEILMIPKIIYLDADVFVNCDVNELWNIELGNNCLAAVRDYGVTIGEKPWPIRKGDVLSEHYFNSGVLLINLDEIRKKTNMKFEMIHYIKNNPESIFIDQDALNVIYKDSTLLIDDKWNHFVLHDRNYNINELKPMIYHFAGTVMCINTISSIDILYFETMIKTPWENRYLISNLKRDLGRLKDRVNLIEKLLKKMNDSTKYVFYGLETYHMKQLYALLNADPNKDYRVMEVADCNGILECKNLEFLKDESNCIVFVLPEADEGRSIRNLERLGLKNEEDFFVIPRLVSYKNGGYIY